MTLAQLARGQRLTEILKQDIHALRLRNRSHHFAEQTVPG